MAAPTKAQKQEWLEANGLQRSAMFYLRKSDGWDWKTVMAEGITDDDLVEALRKAHEVKKVTLAKQDRTVPDTETPFWKGAPYSYCGRAAQGAQRVPAPKPKKEEGKPQVKRKIRPITNGELGFLATETVSDFAVRTGVTVPDAEGNTDGWVLFEKKSNRVYGVYESKEEAFKRAVLWER